MMTLLARHANIDLDGDDPPVPVAAKQSLPHPHELQNIDLDGDHANIDLMASHELQKIQSLLQKTAQIEGVGRSQILSWVGNCSVF